MKHFKTIGWTTLAWLFATMPALALDPDKQLHHFVRDTWSIEHGLPQATVQAITQDAEGYIWVGTQAGAARFDGVAFTHFTPETAPELPGMMVNSLLAHPDGRVFIGTYRGLAVYENRVLRSVPMRLPQDDAVAPDIRALGLGQRGWIYAATSLGLLRVDDRGIQAVPGIDIGPSFSLLIEDALLWVGGSGGVHRVQDGQAVFLPLPERHRAAAVTALERSQGRLWAGSQRGLFVQDSDGERWLRFDAHPDLASLPIDMLFTDSRGSLWVGTVKGLVRIRNGAVVEVTQQGDPGAIPAVRSMFQDREGNLWVGSQWQALNRLWDGWARRYSQAEGLHMPIVWSIARSDDDRLWVGTGDGLTVLRDGRFEVLVPGDQLPHPDAYTLLAEGSALWIGTRSGLAYHDGLGLRTPPEFDALRSAQVNAILRDPAGDLWLGTSAGLFRHRDGALDRFGVSEGLPDPRVRTLLTLPGGILLIGTQGGLYQMDSEGIRPFDRSSTLPSDIDITALHRLDDGLIAVGSLGEHLFLGDGERWLDVAALPEVPTNSPFFITHDRHDHLWVAGIRGVYALSLTSLRGKLAGLDVPVEVEVVLSERGDQRGGQKVHCCNGAGNAKGLIHDDLLWLPTRDGLLSLPALAKRDGEPAPSPVVERVRTLGIWHAVLPGMPMQIDAEGRDVTIEFTALSFRDPGSLRIRYRLRGYSDIWEELADTGRRSVTYTNLPAREYVFEVNAANGRDVWAHTPARLEFRVSPYFHETVWFAVLVLAAVIALASGVFHLLLRRHVRREQHLERLVSKRTEDLETVNRRLEAMTLRDPLTGLHNRRFLIDQLPSDLAHFHRCHPDPDEAQSVMVFALIDLDAFKPINDCYGHLAGDLILKQFAELLEAQIRSGDYAVRWGGEEFLLVMRPMPQDETTRVVERIRAATAAHPFRVNDEITLQVTCSIGMVEYPRFRGDEHDLGWERMVALADYAMYQVKSGGRNGWALLRPTATTRFDSLIEDVQQLGAAMIATGELDLQCSPGIVIDGSAGGRTQDAERSGITRLEGYRRAVG